MMGTRQRTAGIARCGDEIDVVTGWRRLYTRYQRAGKAHRAKQSMARRERRDMKLRLKSDDPGS